MRNDSRAVAAAAAAAAVADPDGRRSCPCCLRSERHLISTSRWITDLPSSSGEVPEAPVSSSSLLPRSGLCVFKQQVILKSHRCWRSARGRCRRRPPPEAAPSPRPGSSSATWGWPGSPTPGRRCGSGRRTVRLCDGYTARTAVMQLPAKLGFEPPRQDCLYVRLCIE